MFYSIVLRLQPKIKSVLPSYTGYFTLAVFMKLLALADSQLAGKLHQDNHLKPFTISPLLGNFQKVFKGIFLSDQNFYFLKITLLDVDLFSKVIKVLLDFNQEEILIGKHIFDLKEVMVNANQHPQAGFVILEDLWEKISNKKDTCAMDFLSPTTFKLKDDNYFLPEPKKVFSSLEKKLSVFSQKLRNKIDINEVPKFLSKIRLTRFENLSTNLIELKQGKQIGFTGRAFYQIKSEQNKEIKFFNLLACLSKYLGVGAKTSLGFGQVREVFNAN